MKLDQLSYFVAAAKHENVGKAARLEAISPSAISHSVAALEEELGIQLFLRERKRIRLTDQGRLLLERAEKVLRDVSRIKNDLIADNVELEGQFRLASTQSIAARFVTAAWSKLQSKNPKLGTSLQILRSKDIVAKASISEIDLGLCFGPVANPDVQSKVLATEPFVVAVRKGHPILASGIQARAGVLSKLACAAPRSYQGRSDFEHSELERLKITQQVDFIFETYDVAIQRLLHSNSWGLIPSWYLRQSYKGLEKVDLPKWDARVDIVAVWTASRPLGRAMSRLCEAISTEAHSTGTARGPF
jgi:DNA-binding transcriptional LysR family regulator